MYLPAVLSLLQQSKIEPNPQLLNRREFTLCSYNCFLKFRDILQIALVPAFKQLQLLQDVYVMLPLLFIVRRTLCFLVIAAALEIPLFLYLRGFGDLSRCLGR